jgi:RimJ/RimL family protein N-acetyltransferase
LIGAYIGDRLVGIIYIIKGEPADVAFATDPDFEDIGIASALLCIAIQILKQVDGRVNVQTCTLTENLPMRKVFERQPGMRYVPQSFRDDDYDPSVSKFAYNNS